MTIVESLCGCYLVLFSCSLALTDRIYTAKLMLN